jgi:hypothetical protein
MDIASCADAFDRYLFCRQLELWLAVSGREIYLRYLRVECGMAGASVDDFYVEMETVIH